MMLNAEYYKEKIKKVGLAFGFVNGEIVPCSGTDCNECDFSRDVVKGCSLKTTEWLISEHKEPITLTAREKHFVEFAKDGWLARDESGELYFYKDKPHKCGGGWWESVSCRLKAFGDFFPFIKRKDKEPWSVAGLRKLEVQDA